MNITSPIAKKLQQLIDIKRDINTSINNKGVEVTEETFFKDYASSIDRIEQKDTVVEEELINTKVELEKVKKEFEDYKSLMDKVRDDFKLIAEGNGEIITEDLPLESYPSIIDKIMGTLLDTEGKAYLLEVLYEKNADLENVINMDSSLTDIANIVLTIGAMNMRFRENLKTTKQTRKPYKNKIKLPSIKFIPTKINEDITGMNIDLTDVYVTRKSYKNIISLDIKDGLENVLELPLEE